MKGVVLDVETEDGWEEDLEPEVEGKEAAELVEEMAREIWDFESLESGGLGEGIHSQRTETEVLVVVEEDRQSVGSH